MPTATETNLEPSHFGVTASSRPATPVPALWGCPGVRRRGDGSPTPRLLDGAHNWVVAPTRRSFRRAPAPAAGLPTFSCFSSLGLGVVETVAVRRPWQSRPQRQLSWPSRAPRQDEGEAPFLPRRQPSEPEAPRCGEARRGGDAGKDPHGGVVGPWPWRRLSPEESATPAWSSQTEASSIRALRTLHWLSNWLAHEKRGPGRLV